MKVQCDFSGKTVIITGSGRGLGTYMAEAFRDTGANVVVTDIIEERVKEAEEQVKAKNPDRVLAMVSNVTSEESMDALVNATVEKFGGLDIMIVNAATIAVGAVTEIDPDRWRQQQDVNLYGYFMSARAACKVMIPKKSGVIIQINSKSGKRGSYKNSGYAASKFGGIGLTQSLALELAELNIRVNSVCPGNLLDSPMWTGQLYDEYAEKLGITPEEVRKMYVEKVPMGRGCDYKDVTGLVMFLASDAASYMTGQAVNVTGGQVMD